MLRAVSALLVCHAALAMDVDVEGFGAIEVDVEDFGAKADNKTLSSVGINAALKAVAARGGGVVHARAKGTYRVARVELQSHTELRIGPKTVLYASDAEEDWTDRAVEVPEKCGGAGIVQNATRGGVFFAVRQSNFSITGGGTVNGGGAKWNNDARRAHFLEFFFCSDVVVEDLTIKNSSQWTLRPSYSQRLDFRRLTILGDTTGANQRPASVTIFERF
jgi:polygalacturonase